MGTRERTPAFIRGAVVIVLAVVGPSCAAAPQGSRDAGVVTVDIGGGQTLEVRRGEDLRVNPRVEVSPADAWAALAGVYEAIGVEVDVRDTGRMQLGASAHRFSRRILNRSTSEYFDCGLDPGLNRPLADQVPVTARVVTTVIAAGQGAELATVAEGTARRSGGNAGIATCRSTGLMEALVAEMVKAAAGGG